MILRLSILLAASSAAACSNGASSAPDDSRQSTGGAVAVPRRATIGRDGYATINDAPAAPFTPVEPRPATPLAPTPDQLARQQQLRRAAKFQNQFRKQVEALTAKLLRAEKGNFVDLYYENEGEPHVVVRFLHDGRATLHKYTNNPSFVAVNTRYSREELRAAMNFMFETFRGNRVIQSGGIGNKQNRAVININVPQPEFRELVARRRVKIPEAVELHFSTARPASAINRQLALGIARLIRIFPQADRPLGPVELIESRAKVILGDGCFKLADHGNALVLFPIGAQLFIDRDGYLALGSGEVPGYARVGEEIVTPGTISEITAPELVERIHAACGPGKVMKLNGIQSAAAWRAQQAVTTNANSLRQLRAFYGLPDAEARTVFDACKKQMGRGFCVLSPPPPMRPENCPPGTRFSSGLCRTPEGFIRPLPKWIQKLLAQ